MNRPPAPWWTRLRLPRARTVAGQRRVRALAWIGGALLTGYLASMLIFPAPLMNRETPVARVIGQPIDDAERELTEQGFRPRIEDHETDPSIPADHVLWQDPPPGVELEAGTLIRLTVSDGPAAVVVPDLAEFGFDQAVRVLGAGGLRAGAVDSVAAAQPAGVVLSTRPPAGSSRPSGSDVDLVVSRGPATIRVPSVVGLDQVAAREALERVGLRVGVVQSRTARDLPPGQVLEQRPGAGTLGTQGAAISLTIARLEDP